MTYPKSHDMTKTSKTSFTCSKTSIYRNLGLISKCMVYAHITKVVVHIYANECFFYRSGHFLLFTLLFSLISTSSCISSPEFFLAYATSHSIWVMSSLDITNIQFVSRHPTSQRIKNLRPEWIADSSYRTWLQIYV